MPLANGSVFRVAAESAPNGVIICDEQGDVLFANHHIEATFGYGSGELVGCRIDDLVPLAYRTSDRNNRYDSRQEPQADGMATGRNLSGRRKDGSEVHVEVGLSLVEQAERRLVIASIIDMTERLSLQNEIARTSNDYASFERLISEVASRFVMVAPEQVDGAIVESIQLIAEALDLDRGSWWQVKPGSDDPVVVHTWTRPEYRIMQAGDSAQTMVPWILARARAGEIVTFAHPDELPNRDDRETQKKFSTKSGIAVPVILNGELNALLGFGAIRAHRDWPPELVDRIRLVSAVFSQAVTRKTTEQRLEVALAEVHELQKHLAMENVYLRREVTAAARSLPIAADSDATRKVLEQIEAVAPTNATVLLLGETGTGKEVFAKAIHRASDLHRRPMITVNCAAIPTALIESELFGRERGAYTGAMARQIGRFEMANDSTIFLDEVGELPLDAQAKLLRVLQERTIERLGSGQPIKVNVRVIAATNRALDKAIADHTFREDLYYRLNVFPIRVPPLRERVEDIPALVWTFIEEYSAAFRKPIESISKDSIAALQHYSWPGNVRELRNVIERAVINARGPRLIVEVPSSASASPPKRQRLVDLEAEQIRQVLESVAWRVRGQGGAAEVLGIKPNTLDSRMARLGIRRPMN
ncbi:MAG TPA: sigma 54-interacting transcriptional regulator [Vicinamibacterales bacterium]|jgi:PAS domain S-box-containing protein